MALLNKLIPNGHIRDVTSSFGTHYEITSVLVRLLGGKVGKRVYWPGNGPSVDNFDLIDVGDDVVFGSRAHLVTSDGAGADYVRIADGAMVADRVAVLPGCHVGEQAVLGSGALTRRGAAYDAGSTWIGSRAGGPVCLTTAAAASPRSTDGSFLDVSWDEKTLASEPASDSDTATLLETGSTLSDSITPFGRAFYRNEAPYRVLGLFTITAYSILTNVFISIYWNIPTIFSLQVLSHVSNLSCLSHFFAKSAYRPLSILSVLFVSFSVTQVTLSILALAACVCAKWLIMGRRTAGSFDWDKSDYCQRWQMLLTIERIRLSGEDILSMLTGTAYLASYFRLLGARIGADCALFAGGELSLSFTEPDLLTLGDRVAVDDASLVGHINSRGNFNLNPLAIGDRSVLRTGSRLLSGATMGKDACLLEHTLVMAGDEVEDGATCQGWPADSFTGTRVSLAGETKEREREQDIEMDQAGDWMGRVGGEVKRWFGKEEHEQRYERIVITVEEV
jgi:acetyltransferase-like isoleucine patch superfamily enzyme